MNQVSVFGVVGSGQMGSGIAQVAALAGCDVIIVDSNQVALNKSVANIGSGLEKLVAKGKMQASEREAALAKIRTTLSLTDLAGCDFVVEAVTENVSVKTDIFRAVDACAKPHTILASNTSSISITRLAGVTRRPDRVIGMHFMNPVPLMKLVEIVRALQTSESTYATTVELARRMNKTVVTTKDMPGFVVNRMLIPFINEACFALQDGLGSVEEIDEGARLGLNHPMGPLQLADLIGLDTCLAIAEVLQREFGEDKYRPCPLLRNYVAAGWLGRKTNRGFYIYSGGKQERPSGLPPPA